MKTFTVTTNHIKLLERLEINDNGSAPYVSEKRPYGNSDIYGDILEITLGKDHGLPEEAQVALYTWCDGLHKDMSTVLQILIRNLKIQVGEYQASDYGTDWKLFVL